MRKTLFLFCFFALSGFSQTMYPSIDSIFMQKGDAKNLFFYHKNRTDKSTFLQKQDLISAFYSNETKMQLSNQLGVFFADDSYKILQIDKDSVASNMGLKTGDTIINFSGIKLSNSRDGFLANEYEDGRESPSFMLTISRQGDTIEFGGDIRNIQLKEIGETFLEKFEKN